MSSSRPEQQQVVQHFTHIHPLTKVDGFGEFTCNGCNSYGYGSTYRCTSCDYDLHTHCATCPLTLLSFIHPQHEPRLVFKGPDQIHQNRRICDICGELVNGLYYHCEACGFDVHPLCTQLPQHVSHVSHPAHALELSDRGAHSTCMVCHRAIRSWRYKCGPCGLDVHMECVNPSTSVAKGIQRRSLEQPYSQYHQSYHIQQGSFGQRYSQQYHQPYQGSSAQPCFHPAQYYHQPYHNYNHNHNHGYKSRSATRSAVGSEYRKNNVCHFVDSNDWGCRWCYLGSALRCHSQLVLK